MFKHFFQTNERQLAVKLKKHLANDSEFFAIFPMNESQALIATLQELLLVEDDNKIASYGWEEFALARWEEKGLLTFIFHDGRPNLEFKSKNLPAMEFLDTVREGIMETQVFAGVLHLPSGAEITARVLRDSHRNFFIYPLPSSLKNTNDQQLLYNTYLEWKNKLGIDIKIGANPIR